MPSWQQRHCETERWEVTQTLHCHGNGILHGEGLEVGGQAGELGVFKQQRLGNLRAEQVRLATRSEANVTNKLL